MRVELDVEEVWALLSLIVNRVADEAGLEDEERARLKLWRSEDIKLGGDLMKALTQKVNEDLERAVRGKERSQVRKPDWSTP